jgi:site-specific recombinase XerC
MLQEYRLWRQEEDGLKKITLYQQMSPIRVFLKWCGSIEAVPAHLYEKVMVPRVSPDEERSEGTIDADTADSILEYLSRFHYTSIEHAVFGIFWETGSNVGAVNSLVAEDIDVEEERRNFVHRRETGTQLNNGK